MLIISLFIGLFIIGLGFFIKKYPDTLAGYNTMSTMKKKNVDIHKITSVYKNGFIVIGITTILFSATFNWLKFYEFAVIALIAPLLIGVLILVAITQKYDHNKQSKVKKMLPTIIVGSVTIIVTLAMYGGSRPTKVLLKGNDIEFTGQYGLTISKDNIQKVDLLNTIPRIKMRTNGLGLGRILKGHFTLEQFGSCRLFLRLPNPPFLYIELNNGNKILFNSVDTQYTKMIYGDIK